MPALISHLWFPVCVKCNVWADLALTVELELKPELSKAWNLKAKVVTPR